MFRIIFSLIAAIGIMFGAVGCGEAQPTKPVKPKDGGKETAKPSDDGGEKEKEKEKDK